MGTLLCYEVGQALGNGQDPGKDHFGDRHIEDARRIGDDDGLSRQRSTLSERALRQGADHVLHSGGHRVHPSQGRNAKHLAQQLRGNHPGHHHHLGTGHSPGNAAWIANQILDQDDVTCPEKLTALHQRARPFLQ